MLGVAHVTAKDWLGSLPEPGGAFYLGGEDDEKERSAALERRSGARQHDPRDRSRMGRRD